MYSDLPEKCIPEEDILASHNFNDILDAIKYFGSYQNFIKFKEAMQKRYCDIFDLFVEFNIIVPLYAMNEPDGHDFSSGLVKYNFDYTDRDLKDYLSYLKSLTNGDIIDIIQHEKDFDYLVKNYVLDNNKLRASKDLDGLYDNKDLPCDKLLDIYNNDEIIVNYNVIFLQKSNITLYLDNVEFKDNLSDFRIAINGINNLKHLHLELFDK